MSCKVIKMQPNAYIGFYSLMHLEPNQLFFRDSWGADELNVCNIFNAFSTHVNTLPLSDEEKKRAIDFVETGIKVFCRLSGLDFNDFNVKHGIMVPKGNDGLYVFFIGLHLQSCPLYTIRLFLDRQAKTYPLKRQGFLNILEHTALQTVRLPIDPQNPERLDRISDWIARNREKDEVLDRPKPIHERKPASSAAPRLVWKRGKKSLDSLSNKLQQIGFTYTGQPFSNAIELNGSECRKVIWKGPAEALAYIIHALYKESPPVLKCSSTKGKFIAAQEYFELGDFSGKSRLSRHLSKCLYNVNEKLPSKYYEMRKQLDKAIANALAQEK